MDKVHRAYRFMADRQDTIVEAVVRIVVAVPLLIPGAYLLAIGSLAVCPFARLLPMSSLTPIPTALYNQEIFALNSVLPGH